MLFLTRSPRELWTHSRMRSMNDWLASRRPRLSDDWSPSVELTSLGRGTSRTDLKRRSDRSSGAQTYPRIFVRSRYLGAFSTRRSSVESFRRTRAVKRSSSCGLLSMDSLSSPLRALSSRKATARSPLFATTWCSRSYPGSTRVCIPRPRITVIRSLRDAPSNACGRPWFWPRNSRQARTRVGPTIAESAPA